MNTYTPALDRTIIQGGMGVYISTPFLARTVSCHGGLGTVSGTALERIMALILQMGDTGGHYRRALAQFPYPHIAEQIIEKYYIEGGWQIGMPRTQVPLLSVDPTPAQIALIICANYASVWLAKEGHDHPVSINYLEKIAMPHIYALTGALLAGVDYVTMGAGIPLSIPQVMRDIAEDRPVQYDVPVIGTHIKSHKMTYHPRTFLGKALPQLKIPGFIPIIASNLLADVYMKKLDHPQESLAGFVIEEPSAGGHNAPPRTRVPVKSVEDTGATKLVYGVKDVVDYERIARLGIPFWIGGSYASPERCDWAQSVGARGIQVGTIFALCEDSGLRPDIRREICAQGFLGTLHTDTHMQASPTGFPFKVVQLKGTLSDDEVRMSRGRVCDQGALAYLYEKPDGSIGRRCPAEPIEDYVRKGGDFDDTVNACCLCNGLINATILAQPDDIPIVTLGDDVSFLAHFMCTADSSYSAAQALAYLQGA